jgi:hypothetical protein
MANELYAQKYVNFIITLLRPKGRGKKMFILQMWIKVTSKREGM